MRTYLRRRTAACPTGEHVQVTDDPDDPTRQIEKTVNCDCPWLVIQETQPVPHMMVWSTPESVQRLIAEFDRGYFDLEGMPRRARSEFMSPHVSDLLDLIDAKDAVGAAMRLLATVTADQVRWLPETSTLAIRIPFDRGHLEGKTMDTWLQLTFEQGEPIKVDRGPLPETPAGEARLDLTEAFVHRGGMDLAALTEIVDSGREGMHWQLWRTMLNRDHVTRAALSAQAINELVGGALGAWEAAPPPVDGYQPLPDVAGEQLATGGPVDGAQLLHVGEQDDDRFSTVVARGEVVELHRTPQGDIEATAVFPDGVRDLTTSLPVRDPGALLAEARALDAEGTQDRVPGTMYGIRPHAHRTHSEADEARAILLAAGPLGADTVEGLRSFIAENQRDAGLAGVHNPLIEGPCVQIPCPPFSPDEPAPDAT